MIKVFDTEKKQYYPFDDYMESLTNDNLYGRPRSFLTSGTPFWTDLDGNVYWGVTIGNQIWIIENYKCTKYADGSDIILASLDADWIANTEGAYCHCYNDDDNFETLGLLYNWAALTNVKGLPLLFRNGVADSGWRLPTANDLIALINNVGEDEGSEQLTAGGKLKSTALWDSPNSGADNESGFTALPSGIRAIMDGSFSNEGEYAAFWSATQFSSTQANAIKLSYNDEYCSTASDKLSPNGYLKGSGLAVRLVRNLL